MRTLTRTHTHNARVHAWLRTHSHAIATKRQKKNNLSEIKSIDGCSFGDEIARTSIPLRLIYGNIQ